MRRKTGEDAAGGGGVASLTLEVEAPEIGTMHGPRPLSGRVFYILDKSAAAVLKENKDAIWGELIRKFTNSKFPDADKILGRDIVEILGLPDDDERKYPVALTRTAAAASNITPLISACCARAIDALRTAAAAGFLLTDNNGKAEIENLAAKTYYICGVGWNVRVDLKPGKNSLKLDGANMAGRKDDLRLR